MIVAITTRSVLVVVVKSPPANPLVEPQQTAYVDQPDETKGSDSEIDTLSDKETEEIIEKKLETIFEQDGEILNEQVRTTGFGQDRMAEQEKGNPDEEEEEEETLPGQNEETIREVFTGIRVRVIYGLLRLGEILQELIALEPSESATDTKEIFETWAMQTQRVLDQCK